MNTKLYSLIFCILLSSCSGQDEFVWLMLFPPSAAVILPEGYVRKQLSSSTHPTNEEINRDYNRQLRTEANMPSIWFSCIDDSNCTSLPVPCRLISAVNMSYYQDAENALAGLKKPTDCPSDEGIDPNVRCYYNECIAMPRTNYQK